MTCSIVMLASDGMATRIIYNALSGEFSDVTLLMERSLPRITMLRRRRRRLGLAKVTGQIAFMGAVYPLLDRASRSRQMEILATNDLDPCEVSGACYVPSVNSTQAQAHLRTEDPRVVVVNGTRIIGRETLSCVKAPFVNMHAGITPAFRGVHGGYWALREGRPDAAGTTVHLLDEGIDTGPVLAQRVFTPIPADAFPTYPLLQIAVGLPLLLDAVHAALEGRLEPVAGMDTGLPSRLWSHPTLWEYLVGRLGRGVA